MNLDKITKLVDLLKEDTLKGIQYAFIFMTWLYQRVNNKPKSQKWFALYQKIFHSRRLFRVLGFIVYLPSIKRIINQMKQDVSIKNIFMLLGNISVALFLIFDNVSVIMMILGNTYYRYVRRISYSIFLFGVIWQIISMSIKLRQSFTQQSDIKKNLQELTPIQFLQQLNQIDEQRKFIAIQFINLVGDFVPALARTNLPQIIVRTKVNKGTVGFFGMVASLTGILLKLKKQKATKIIHTSRSFY